MKLLLTSHRLFPHVGGTEIAVDHLARCFAARRHDVTVVTSAEEGAPAREARHGYAIERVPVRSVGHFRVPPREYRARVLRGDHDLAHLHGQRVWSTDHLFPYLRHARNALVLTPHGFAQWHRRRRPIVDAGYYRLALPRALRRIPCVTALTQREKEDLLGWGVDEDRVVVIPDGYDPREFAALPSGFRARFGFAPDEKLLLYAGGFYPNKRVDRLVDACAGLDATLVVLGADADGSRALVEAQARAAGTRLRVLGRIPREDVLSAYKEADLFLLGSDFEGFGLVLLEAMAAGLPFVSTPCGAAPELAATGAGLVLPGTAEMREAVRALLADPARRRDMGRRGQTAAPGYAWETVADRYLTLFEEVARR